jgi:type IV pilus assembly protein PilM
VRFNFNIFSPDAHLRPKLACEIMPGGVIAARYAENDQSVMAFVPLEAGVVTPGLKTPNLVNPAQVVAALRRTLEEVSSRERQLTVVVPDAAARVLILDFDTLPTKRQDVLPIMRFRLRKLVPFEVEDAAVSYQVMSQQTGQTRALVTVMPHAVLTEYEIAVREAGYEPGVVLPSTLASLAALRQVEPALVVNRNGLTVTTRHCTAENWPRRFQWQPLISKTL